MMNNSLIITIEEYTKKEQMKFKNKAIKIGQKFKKFVENNSKFKVNFEFYERFTIPINNDDFVDLHFASLKDARHTGGAVEMKVQLRMDGKIEIYFKNYATATYEQLTEEEFLSNKFMTHFLNGTYPKEAVR